MGLQFSRVCTQTVNLVPEGVRPLVPTQLTTDTVSDSGDKLSAQPELRTKLQSKLLWRVFPLRHIPLKLVHQRDVPNMDVQLEIAEYDRLSFTAVRCVSAILRLTVWKLTLMMTLWSA